MITDLFSHKIHASGYDWPGKLVDIATIFSEFDGLPYDRGAIEERFKKISPRASIDTLSTTRDVSKFRDEISAYPAYLGLYWMQWNETHWILRMSETAKRFLIIEEPNVAAFLILQSIFFQHPNGKGVVYHDNGNPVVQANSRNKTLSIIKDGIHISPFRLICKALLADSIINGVSPLHPSVTVEEIFILANDARTNKTTSPVLDDVVTVLNEARAGLLAPPTSYENRFHLLNHTDFIEADNRWIRLRETINPEEREDFIRRLQIINSIEFQFNGFDNAKTGHDLSTIIKSGDWGRYFDALNMLTSETVQALTNESLAPVSPISASETISAEADDIVPDNKAIQFNYELRERGGSSKTQLDHFRKGSQPVDPEVTRIKRQRSNTEHKILISKMTELLINKGAIPLENEHIDLFSQIPGDGKFLFEMKSVSSENLLSQTRKGLSQLYEYKYRYKAKVGSDVTLCLVYNKEPSELDWIKDYLCDDRDIAVCWFDGETLIYPAACADKMQNLL